MTNEKTLLKELDYLNIEEYNQRLNLNHLRNNNAPSNDKDKAEYYKQLSALYEYLNNIENRRNIVLSELQAYNDQRADARKTVSVKKVAPDAWEIKANKEVIATAKRSYKYGGSYEAEMTDGVIIYATTQSVLKEMVSEHIS